jgi:hypothetical protein
MHVPVVTQHQRNDAPEVESVKVVVIGIAYEPVGTVMTGVAVV